MAIQTMILSLCAALIPCGTAAGRCVVQSERKLPVAYSVDVAVVGGSTGAVAAAVAAAKGGASVFLATSQPYLGEDMCATLRLWREPGEEPAGELARAIWSDGSGGLLPPLRAARPMHVKRTLDKALLDANVAFLYGCFATEVLRDEGGRLAGIAMANRSGRQAVVAKVVIDATDRAWVARLAGAAFRRRSPGPATFRRIVIGGKPVGADGRELRVELPAGKTKRSYGAVEYTLTLPAGEGGFAASAAAEQLARDRTFQPGQVEASDVLFHVPLEAVRSAGPLAGDWPGAEKLPVGAFRPADMARLFVLGGCADVPHEAAERLLRPIELMKAGERIGAAAAAEARALPAPSGVGVAIGKAKAPAAGEVREVLTGPRPSSRHLPTVPSPAGALAVLGEVDVLVVGGGTSGAAAAIAAARMGARVLVVEYLHGLGGVGTMGLIGKYWRGNRVGFTREVPPDGGPAKAEWWRSEIRKAGGEVWFGAIGCGALVNGGRVTGAVVATPAGRGVVLARTVIDATGNADLAAAAGAETIYTDAAHVNPTGAGLPPRELGETYVNSNYMFADDSDTVDIWHLRVYAKAKFPAAYDLARLVDTRVRRRVVGEVVLSPLDILRGRRYADTIAVYRSNFDFHGLTVHPVFFLTAPPKGDWDAHVPYRALLPRGLDGLLVAGIGMSGDADAMILLRMQPDVQNQGYAAGVAAAMAAKADKTVRGVDVRALQGHLVKAGNLPESVLKDTEAPERTAESLAEAVRRLAADAQGEMDLPLGPLATVLARGDEALALLRDAHRRARRADHKLIYAKVLGMLGDAAGAETLIEAVRARPWDDGWEFRGMGQAFAAHSVSAVDSLVIALGRAGEKRAVPVLVEKLRALDAKAAFSHHRAVAMALEHLADPAAAGPLAGLLSAPGMTGHATTTLADALAQADGSKTQTRPRNDSLRELLLARALYRCGDRDGLGERILRRYAADLRGHYARHATAVLEASR